MHNTNTTPLLSLCYTMGLFQAAAMYIKLGELIVLLLVS